MLGSPVRGYSPLRSTSPGKREDDSSVLKLRRKEKEAGGLNVRWIGTSDWKNSHWNWFSGQQTF